MGFLDSFVDSRLNTMSDSDLQREWNKLLGNRSLNDPPDTDFLKKLDARYGERFGITKTWKYRADKNKEEANQKKREEEKKRQEQEKKRQENQAFSQKLNSNPMVQELTDALNQLSYDACYIEVYGDNVTCLDDTKAEKLVFRYKKYGYPDLDEEKQTILCKHLLRSLQLNYVSKGRTRLELNDAPGGMKTEW